MKIDGSTQIIAHLCFPSAHLRTAQLLNPIWAESGHNAVLIPWQVHPKNLESVFSSLRHSESVAGVLVTVPHKTSVAALCDELSGTASFLGAANVAKRTSDGRFIGQMFDGDGFVQGLISQGHAVKGRKVLLIGAGGAASGIAFALVKAGVSSLTINNRTVSKSKALALKLNQNFNCNTVKVGISSAGGHDLIVNGTSLGMSANDSMPFDPNTIDRGALLAEVVMEPEQTPILKAAEALGILTHGGKHMITSQLELFTDFLLGSKD